MIDRSKVRGAVVAWCAALAVGMTAAAGRGDDDMPRVPEGFTVERIAAAPLVERPVTCDFDERGRLYVTESSGSNDKVERQQADPTHRVLRLEDADGDGVFDTRTVYAEKLMLPEGSLWWRGSLYVAAPPVIWRFTDADDDGVAEERAVWFDGRTLTGCANDLHGPYLGRDGRFYWCKGAFAEQRHDLPGRPGWTTRASHVFRARPDGTEIEPVLTGGMDNPVDVVFTAGGERILSCTFLVHPGGGQRDGLIHALYGGVYGKDHGVLDGHPRTGGLLPALAHLGPAAPAGLHLHSGFGCGPVAAGDLFTCAFNLRTVMHHRLVAAGASFTTVDEPFVQSDSVDFHPTDVIEDADGSLVVVDTGGWYKLCCPTSQLEKPAALGAIYRVRHGAAPPVDDPRGRALDWDAVAAAPLAARLADPRPAVVARATDRLAVLGDAAVPALAALLARRPPPAPRTAAVWALCRIDGPAARAAVREALADPDPLVRQAASHAAGLHRDGATVAALAPLVVADTPAVARAAAEALGRIGDAAAAGALVAATARSADRALDHAILYGLIESRRADVLRAALAGPPAARRAALIALDQAADPPPGAALVAADVLPACDAADPALRAAAWWVAAHHPEWAAELAERVTGQLEAMAGADPAVRESIVAILAPLAADERVAGAVATALDGDDPALNAAARDVIRAARVPRAPDAWMAALSRLALAPTRRDTPAAAAGSDAIAVLAGLPLTKDQRAAWRPTAFQIEAAGVLAPGAILQALALVGDATGDLPEVIVGRLLLVATQGESPVDRGAAAAILASAALSPPGRQRIADAFAHLRPQEATLLLPMLVAEGGDPLVAAVEGLLAGDGADGLRPDLIAMAVAKLPAEAAPVAAALVARSGAAAAAEREAFEALWGALPAGDVARGHAVFAGKTGACTSCHAMAYVGGRVGPDLSHIGSIRTPRDLLEAIVRPSASFVRSYEPSVVVTADGRSFQGVVREEPGGILAVQTSATVVERIPRDLVEAIEPGRVSLMPHGYDKLLSAQELADLVAFLHRAK
ncbi:MAG: PVC-type heme-binding CxxCH protein [Planctomycetaceae bacterium]